MRDTHTHSMKFPCPQTTCMRMTAAAASMFVENYVKKSQEQTATDKMRPTDKKRKKEPKHTNAK